MSTATTAGDESLPSGKAGSSSSSYTVECTTSEVRDVVRRTAYSGMVAIYAASRGCHTVSCAGDMNKVSHVATSK